MKNLILIGILTLSINVFAQMPSVGLVAYYPFNGNANDMSGHNYNGIINGATFGYDRFGNNNSACSFNGTSDYIDLSSYVSNFNFPQPASISFWVYTIYDSPQTIYSLDDGAAGNNESNVYIGSNTTGTLNNELIVVPHQNGLNDYYIVGYTTTNRYLLIETDWHHIVVTYNDTLTTVYLDNNIVSLSCTFGSNNGHYGNLTNASKVLLGTRYNNGYGSFLNGFLDEVRIYNVALNAAQVDTLYNETITLVEPKPYNFNSINIYPNPTKEKVNINCNFNYKSIEVLNIFGEVIHYYKQNKFNTNYEIDLSNSPKGIYFVKINDGERIYLRKVVTY